MESTFLSSAKLASRRFLMNPSVRRKHGHVRRVVKARSDEHDGKLVDESMIVLRLRIKEIKMLESSHELQANWAEWEKRCFPCYDQDVCEVIGLLQTFLMNTRPCLALGMLVLFALSIPISTYIVMHNTMNMGQELLSMFHLVGSEYMRVSSI